MEFYPIFAVRLQISFVYRVNLNGASSPSQLVEVHLHGFDKNRLRRRAVGSPDWPHFGRLHSTRQRKRICCQTRYPRKEKSRPKTTSSGNAPEKSRNSSFNC